MDTAETTKDSGHQQANVTSQSTAAVPTKSVDTLAAEEVIVTDYQKQTSFAERYADSQDCREKYPECVPLIIERAALFNSVAELPNCKFLFGASSQAAQAMVRVQKDLKAKQMWFYVHANKGSKQLKVIYPSQKLGELQENYGRSDGNLYIVYSDKNLADSRQSFIKAMRVVTTILLIFYAYLYLFGVEDVKRIFGYSSEAENTIDVRSGNTDENINGVDAGRSDI